MPQQQFIERSLTAHKQVVVRADVRMYTFVTGAFVIAIEAGRRAEVNRRFRCTGNVERILIECHMAVVDLYRDVRFEEDALAGYVRSVEHLLRVRQAMAILVEKFRVLRLIAHLFNRLESSPHDESRSLPVHHKDPAFMPGYLRGGMYRPTPDFEIKPSSFIPRVACTRD